MFILRRHTLGDGSITDSLSFPILDNIIQDTPWWIGQPTLDSAITLFRQVPRDSGQSTSCTCCTDECVEFSTISLVPDLWPCRNDMSPSVGGVVELIGPYCVVY
jgi:hypothetical protein